MDRKTPHKCTAKPGPVAVVQELPQTPRERKIEELALSKITALEHIATAISQYSNTEKVQTTVPGLLTATPLLLVITLMLRNISILSTTRL